MAVIDDPLLTDDFLDDHSDMVLYPKIHWHLHKYENWPEMNIPDFPNTEYLDLLILGSCRFMVIEKEEETFLIGSKCRVLHRV